LRLESLIVEKKTDVELRNKGIPLRSGGDEFVSSTHGGVHFVQDTIQFDGTRNDLSRFLLLNSVERLIRYSQKESRSRSQCFRDTGFVFTARISVDRGMRSGCVIRTSSVILSIARFRKRRRINRRRSGRPSSYFGNRSVSVRKSVTFMKITHYEND
jgi:hypothetical protein